MAKSHREATFYRSHILYLISIITYLSKQSASGLKLAVGRTSRCTLARDADVCVNSVFGHAVSGVKYVHIHGS